MTTPDTSSTEVLRLVALLRQQDQLIFRISQCANFAEMRPLIAKLCEGTFQRMQDESDRIRTIIIPQIREAYLNASPQADETKHLLPPTDKDHSE